MLIIAAVLLAVVLLPGALFLVALMLTLLFEHPILFVVLVGIATLVAVVV